MNSAKQFDRFFLRHPADIPIEIEENSTIRSTLPSGRSVSRSLVPWTLGDRTASAEPGSLPRSGASSTVPAADRGRAQGRYALETVPQPRSMRFASLTTSYRGQSGCRGF